jgi:DNA-binding LacI/PurR family transcriptional regulator
LLQIGRHTIGFIGGPADEYEVQQRYDGYAAALQESGKTVDPNLVTYGDWSSEAGAQKTQQLLDKVPDLDALFANSDLMAVGSLNTLRKQGLKVPQDVAVVGYDDLSISKATNPSLTTISQNIPMVGKLLAQDLIQNIETGQVINVTLPVKLVIREST